MKEQTYKSLMPDLMEAIFDAGYLIFDLSRAFCSSRMQAGTAYSFCTAS